MLGKQKLKAMTGYALKEAKRLGVGEAEVVIWGGTEELTRFAQNHIHQSVSLTDTQIHVRCILGRKIGVARANRTDPIGIRTAVARAKMLATLQREDPHFHSLPTRNTYRRISRPRKGDKHIGSSGRAQAIAIIIRNALEHDLVASGAFSESDSELGVANSHGVWAYHIGAAASLSSIVMGERGSGFASQNTKFGSGITTNEVSDTAIYKATHGEFVDVPAGEYEVILEPPAVAELLDFFGWLGPNARIYHEDVSFYQGNIGKQLFDSSLTIVDDPFQAAGYPMAFDYEGTPKKKITLVNRGVAQNVVYDSYHGHKYGKENTGHALLAPNTWGPIPTHMVLLPGKQNVSAMIKRVKRGLLITRFWYTRVVHHKKLILTGMTRDGTFFIEHGTIVGRARNLRYTESVLEALKDIRGIGNDLSLEGSEGSPSLVPTLHLGKFRFTGVTQHG
ncbi:hypothetical protein A2973_05495 [Candidatus Gottesmanbacteria bacterium RIFCSPLOWO2_01_FULL_49_10]|uniref:Metalloprotease TldD/E C-terminal domain-containing protein n=1 Tax=Candidatus Gottesmanbacteria bacterium RIFCSPLOWO2_01_FULL_49_10 TaxID=1798396 RepID=A0A1F6B134_9BACT|nr:MAG: hypothetical protein A2973_05495 [Candidatus Gottesmanbacteria bacterium RIFCSPLOWO2_01_FULL_49_10]